MLRYQIATTVGACANFLAGLALFQFLGQIYQSNAQLGPIIGGSAALALGFLLCLLGDIGKRLVRIEEHATGRQSSRRADEEIL